MGQNKCIAKYLCLSLVIICSQIFSAHTLLSRDTSSVYSLKVVAQPTDREYLVFLLGNVFFLTEVVDLAFNSDSTFSLKSDLFVQPAQGTYQQNNKVAIKGEGTTGRFFDLDFHEDIEIQYTFTAFSLGLRGFFMLGGGTRKFIFFVDGHAVSEKFFFLGTGY
jgi:hypothetical protein